EPMVGLRRSSLQKANLVLAPSKYTADHVRDDQDVRSQKIRVLPWALDPQFEVLVTSASKTGAPENFPKGNVILTVGRWLTTERYKGMDTLITALPKLLPRWPDLHLAAVGQGDDRDWLQDLAGENGVTMH